MRIRRQRVRRRRAKKGRWILLLFLLAAALFFFFPKKKEEKGFKGERINIVALFAEEGRLKNLALLSWKRGENKVGIFPFPAAVVVAGNTFSTLYRERGCEGVKEGVEKITGTKVHGYWLFSADGFSRYVDIVGGLKIAVPRRMRQKIGGVLIDVPRGDRLLDGKKATDFIIYKEDPLKDAARWGTAIVALLQSMQRVHPTLLKKAQSYINTDLNPAQRKQIYALLRTSTHLLYEPEVRKERGRWLANIATVRRKISILPHLAETTKVRILNGCGIDGLARRTGKRLSFYKGVEVVGVGNAEESVEHTLILERRTGHAKKISQILRCFRTQRELGGEGEDVLVILGADFVKLSKIRVSIKNGCGIPGLARRMEKKLAKYSEIEVVDVGNAKSFLHKKTLIIATRMVEDADYIRSIIGYGEVEKGEGTGADVVLVLGEDARI